MTTSSGIRAASAACYATGDPFSPLWICEDDNCSIRQSAQTVLRWEMTPLEASMNDVVLQLNCAYCRRPLSLLYERDLTKAERLTSYICPYSDCRVYRIQQIALAGRLLDIWRGHRTLHAEGKAP